MLEGITRGQTLALILITLWCMFVFIIGVITVSSSEKKSVLTSGILNIAGAVVMALMVWFLFPKYVKYSQGKLDTKAIAESVLEPVEYVQKIIGKKN